jgi:predicted Zn-dependent protease
MDMRNDAGMPSGKLDADALAEVLATTPGADDWQILAQHDEEAQLYLIGSRVEARRHVGNERARVILYNDHASHDADAEADAEGGETRVRGVTALSLLASDVEDLGLLDGRLRDAVTMAGLTDNPYYALPDPPTSDFPRVETSDPALAGDMDAALDDARARLEAAVASQPNIRLSSAEFYATRSTNELRTSRNLTGSYAGTLVSLDLVLFAQDGDAEAEMHAELTRRRLDDLQIEGTVQAYSTFARDSLRAVLPGTHRGAVILSGEALSNLFQPLTFHASARAAYQQMSRLQAGESITPEPPRGDRLTLLSDATRPYGLKTAPFDEDGVPASRIAVVEDGLLSRNWADARYAAYLDIPPTGAFANLTITPGSRSLETLRDASDGTVYEVVAFSFLSPDPVSGDFVAEIKLGYRHDASGTVPIKGGSLSGNLFAALGEAYFSSETYSDGTYFGPAGIRFGELAIAGA